MKTERFYTKKLLKKRLLGVGSVCLAMPFWSSQAIAAENNVSSERRTVLAIEEVVVTSQMREQSLQDIPFSVSALTQEDIKNQGITDLSQLGRSVPGLAIVDLGLGMTQISIRGLSSGQTVNDQPGKKETVGLYLDDIPLGVSLFSPDIDTFDLERIEVLRGPQGTLYGAGSLGGTIRYITNKPDLDSIGGNLELGASSVESGAANYELKGVVNIPLVKGKAAVRVAGYTERRGGFIDNAATGEKDINDADRQGGRMIFAWLPTENLEIEAKFLYQDIETNAVPRNDVFNVMPGAPASFGDYQQFVSIDEGVEDQTYLGSLNISYDFPSVRLESITSYMDRDLKFDSDFTIFTYGFLGLTTPSLLADFNQIEGVTQEIRLLSMGSEKLEWVVGGFYSNADRQYGQDWWIPGVDAEFAINSPIDFGAPVDDVYRSRFDLENTQSAIFGEATYYFNEQWSATLGLRVYEVEEKRDVSVAGFFNGGVTSEQGFEYDDDGYTPRVVISYQPSENATLSLQVAEGFRLGGINDALPSTCDAEITQIGAGRTFDSESAMNYEFMAKTHWLENRLSINASLYHIDYEDLQLTHILGCGYSQNVNVPEARSRGVELEVTALPFDNLLLSLGASYIDAEITDVLEGSGLPGAVEGNQLPTSPKFQISASATYNWSVFDAWESYASVQYQHIASSFTFIADMAMDEYPVPGTPSTELPSYSITSFRAGLTDDKWSLDLFVTNLFDKKALLNNWYLQAGGQPLLLGNMVNTPRTFGVKVARTFY